MGSQVYRIRWGIEIWGRERGYIRGHFYEERHHQFVGMAGHGTPFAKMKGLKISQPQSVARIDHTSFLCERSLLPLSLSLSLSLVLSQPRASLLLPTPSIYPFEHPSLTDTAVTRHSSTYPTSVSDVRAFSSLPRLAWKPTVYEILAKTLLRSLLPARPRRRDRTDLDKERERERERRRREKEKERRAGCSTSAGDCISEGIFEIRSARLDKGDSEQDSGEKYKKRQ